MGYVKKSITIKSEHDEWLREMSWLNLSALVQSFLDKMIDGEVDPFEFLKKKEEE